MDQKVRKAIVGAVRKEPFARALNMELVELEKGHSVAVSYTHLTLPTMQ